MTTPETFRVLLATNSVPARADFPHRTKHLCLRVNEFLYKLAHEPSLAGHRIQEHVYKTVPNLATEWKNIDNTTQKLHGVMFDLDYTKDFLDKLEESMRTSSDTRETVSELASKISAVSSRQSSNLTTIR